MKTYFIKIRETIEKTISVDAYNVRQAIKIIEDNSSLTGNVVDRQIVGVESVIDFGPEDYMDQSGAQ